MIQGRCNQIIEGEGIGLQCMNRDGFGPDAAYCKSCTRVWYPEYDTSAKRDSLPRKPQTETNWAKRVFSPFMGWIRRKAWPPGSVWLVRNNVGMFQLPKGRGKMPYGLGAGTSDFVGFKSIVITQEMVGQRKAIFTAIEAKRDGKQTTDKQQKFIDVILENGGIAMRAAPENEAEVLEKLLSTDKN